MNDAAMEGRINVNHPAGLAAPRWTSFGYAKLFAGHFAFDLEPSAGFNVDRWNILITSRLAKPGHTGIVVTRFLESSNYQKYDGIKYFSELLKKN